jgi:biotin carboxyl carrier protein
MEQFLILFGGPSFFLVVVKENLLMNANRLSLVLLLVVGLVLSACAPASTQTEKVKPFQLEPVEGTELSRVILTEKAAQRLDIQTSIVGDEQVGRSQVAQGEVIASRDLITTIAAPASGTVLSPTDVAIPVTGAQVSAGQVVFRLSPFATASVDIADHSIMNVEVPADTILIRMLVSPGQFVEAGQPLFEVADISKVWVRVRTTEAELNRLDRTQNAYVLLLESDDAADEGVEAEAINESLIEDMHDDADDETGDTDFLLFYGIDNKTQDLHLGQHVQVKLAQMGSGKLQRVIPYAAVIYDAEGNTWVYTNPEPLVFVRQPIVIDFIEGDRAVLVEGLAVGTSVVIVGASELLGAETGVSK